MEVALVDSDYIANTVEKVDSTSKELVQAVRALKAGAEEGTNYQVGEEEAQTEVAEELDSSIQ